MMPIEHLASLVRMKVPCEVYIRSAPEVVMEGVVNSFDMQIVPSLLVLDTPKGRIFLNMQDVSFIKEKLEETA
jgi:hypothetical protein